MTDQPNITQFSGQRSAQSQREPSALIRKTVRQLNYIGIFDVPTILDVYNRRLEAAARALQPDLQEAA